MEVSWASAQRCSLEKENKNLPSGSDITAGPSKHQCFPFGIKQLSKRCESGEQEELCSHKPQRRKNLD